MDYQVLSLITDKNYFDNIESMINIKALCKMSYGIFITNMERHETISKLSEILEDSGEIGEFQLDNLKITINNLKTYETELIKIK